jgi:copper chaperone CopZ
MKIDWLPALLAAAMLLAACGGEPAGGDGQEKTPAQAPAAAPTHQCVLAIEGMTCDACVRTITRVLSRCPGVIDVDVDLKKGTGTVRGTGMQLSDLTGAVEKAGYTVAGTEGPIELAAPASEE